MSYWNGQRVLVTGGNGFIGSFVVEQLLAQGARVRSTASHEQTRYRFLDAVASEIEVCVGDLADPEIAARAVKDQDVVLHLAAHVGGIAYNRAHPATLFQKNMTAFLSVIEAARLASVHKFLVTSSACVYPRHVSIPTPESEGFLEQPEVTNAGYGWSKRMQEYLALAYAEEHGFPVVTARPYNAYGPRDDFDPVTSHVIAGLIHKIEQAHLHHEDHIVVWGDGSASRSFLYVEDFARGLLTVAEKAQSPEAYNLGAPEEITMGELAQILIRLSGYDLKMVYDTSKPNGQPRRSCDSSRAQNELNYQTQISLEEGLRRTFDYYRAFIAKKD
jgi:GDP-L-fucose synthase